MISCEDHGLSDKNYAKVRQQIEATTTKIMTINNEHQVAGASKQLAPREEDDKWPSGRNYTDTEHMIDYTAINKPKSDTTQQVNSKQEAGKTSKTTTNKQVTKDQIGALNLVKRRDATKLLSAQLLVASMIIALVSLAALTSNFVPEVEAKIHHSKRQVPVALSQGQAPGGGSPVPVDAPEAGPFPSTGRENTNWWNIWWQRKLPKAKRSDSNYIDNRLLTNDINHVENIDRVSNAEYISEATQPTVRPVVSVSFNGKTINLSEQQQPEAAAQSSPLELTVQSERLLAPGARSLEPEEAASGGSQSVELERDRRMLVAQRESMRRQMQWQSVKPTIIQTQAAAREANLVARDLRTNSRRQVAPSGSQAADEEPEEQQQQVNLGIQMRAAMNRPAAAQSQQATNNQIDSVPTRMRQQNQFQRNQKPAPIQQQQVDDLANGRFEQQQNQMLDYSEDSEPELEQEIAMNNRKNGDSDEQSGDDDDEDRVGGQKQTSDSSSMMMQSGDMRPRNKQPANEPIGQQRTSQMRPIDVSRKQPEEAAKPMTTTTASATTTTSQRPTTTSATITTTTTTEAPQTTTRKSPEQTTLAAAITTTTTSVPSTTTTLKAAEVTTTTTTSTQAPATSQTRAQQTGSATKTTNSAPGVKQQSAARPSTSSSMTPVTMTTTSGRALMSSASPMGTTTKSTKSGDREAATSQTMTTRSEPKSTTTTTSTAASVTTQSPAESSTPATGSAETTTTIGTDNQSSRVSSTTRQQQQSTTTSSSILSSVAGSSEATSTTQAPSSSVKSNETTTETSDEGEGDDEDEDSSGTTGGPNDSSLMNAAGGSDSSDSSEGDDDSDSSDEGDDEGTTTTMSPDQMTPITTTSPTAGPMSSTGSGVPSSTLAASRGSGDLGATTQQPSLTTIDIERLPKGGKSGQQQPGSQSSGSMRQTSTFTSQPQQQMPSSASPLMAQQMTTISGGGDDIARIQPIGVLSSAAGGQNDGAGGSANFVMMTIGQGTGSQRQRPADDDEMAITVPMETLMKMVNQVVEDNNNNNNNRPQMSGDLMDEEQPVTRGSTPTTSAPVITTTTAATTTTQLPPTTGQREQAASEQQTTKRRLQPPPPTTTTTTTTARTPSLMETTTAAASTPSPMSEGAMSQRNGNLMMSSVDPSSSGETEEVDAMMVDGRPRGEEPKIELLNMDLVPIQRLMDGGSSGKTVAPSKPAQRQQQQSSAGTTTKSAPMEQVEIAEVEPGMRLRPPMMGGASRIMMGSTRQQQPAPSGVQLQMQPVRLVGDTKNKANTVYMIMMNQAPEMNLQTTQRAPTTSTTIPTTMTKTTNSAPTSTMQTAGARSSPIAAGSSSPSPTTTTTTTAAAAKQTIAATATTPRASSSSQLTGGPIPLSTDATSATQTTTMAPITTTTTAATTTIARMTGGNSPPSFVDGDSRNEMEMEIERDSMVSKMRRPEAQMTSTSKEATKQTTPAMRSTQTESRQQPSIASTTLAPPTTSQTTARVAATSGAAKSSPSTQQTLTPTMAPTTTTTTRQQQKQRPAAEGQRNATTGSSNNNQQFERLQQPTASSSTQDPRATSRRQQAATSSSPRISGPAVASKVSKSNQLSSSFIPMKLRNDFSASSKPQAPAVNRTTKETPAQSPQTTTMPSLTGMAIRQFGGANRMSVLGQQPVAFGRPAAMTMQQKEQQQANREAAASGLVPSRLQQSPVEPPTFEYGPAIAVRRPDEPLSNGQVPNCTLTGKNFCVLTKDYPMNEVRQAVERSFRSVRIMYEELQTVSDQELHRDDFAAAANGTQNQAAQGKFACQTQVEMMRPGWAKDEITREWMLVVNTDVFPQRVRTESCAQPNTPCEFIAPFYDSTCQQRYSLHRMIAIDPHDPSRSPQVAVFRFPAGCVCRVHPIRKTTTTTSQSAPTTTPNPMSSSSRAARRRR